jgi:hypothetical protein
MLPPALTSGSPVDTLCGGEKRGEGAAAGALEAWRRGRGDAADRRRCEAAARMGPKKGRRIKGGGGKRRK